MEGRLTTQIPPKARPMVACGTDEVACVKAAFQIFNAPCAWHNRVASDKCSWPLSKLPMAKVHRPSGPGICLKYGQTKTKPPISQDTHLRSTTLEGLHRWHETAHPVSCTLCLHLWTQQQAVDVELSLSCRNQLDKQKPSQSLALTIHHCPIRDKYLTRVKDPMDEVEAQSGRIRKGKRNNGGLQWQTTNSPLNPHAPRVQLRMPL